MNTRNRVGVKSHKITMRPSRVCHSLFSYPIRFFCFLSAATLGKPQQNISVFSRPLIHALVTDFFNYTVNYMSSCFRSAQDLMFVSVALLCGEQLLRSLGDPLVTPDILHRDIHSYSIFALLQVRG